MPRQRAEVIDRHGHVVHSAVIELDHEHCVDAECEEVALILAEKSGAVGKAHELTFQSEHASRRGVGRCPRCSLRHWAIR